VQDKIAELYKLIDIALVDKTFHVQVQEAFNDMVELHCGPIWYQKTDNPNHDLDMVKDMLIMYIMREDSRYYPPELKKILDGLVKTFFDMINR